VVRWESLDSTSAEDGSAFTPAKEIVFRLSSILHCRTTLRELSSLKCRSLETDLLLQITCTPKPTDYESGKRTQHKHTHTHTHTHTTQHKHTPRTHTHAHIYHAHTNTHAHKLTCSSCGTPPRSDPRRDLTPSGLSEFRSCLSTYCVVLWCGGVVSAYAKKNWEYMKV